MAPGDAQLDTTIEIVTPENIAFRYHVAGPFRRLPAFLLDVVLQTLIWWAGGALLAMLFSAVGLAGLGFGFWLILWFVLSWFYGGLFETYWNGQTPGKRMMRIRVIASDGQPINGLQAVLRNLLRAIDAQPLFTYQLGLFSAMMNDRFQRLGDLASGTMVVVDERERFRGILQIDEPGVLRLAREIPATFQATPSLARTLAAYAERRLYFPVPRRIEIARHLADPLIRRFGLPAHTNSDHLLCAAYQRTFVADDPTGWQSGGSPFLPSGALVAEPAGRAAGASPFVSQTPAAG